MAEDVSSPRGTIVVQRLRGHLVNGEFTRALEAHGSWRVLPLDVMARMRPPKSNRPAPRQPCTQ